MKLIVNQFSSKPHLIQEAFNVEDIGLDTGDFHFINPVKVNTTVIKEQNNLFVNLDVNGKIEAFCDRCLKEFYSCYDKIFNLVYDVMNKVSIDITDDLRQEIILSYPIQFLCKVDCLGLCQKCGKDLNEGDCGCKIGGKDAIT